MTKWIQNYVGLLQRKGRSHLEHPRRYKSYHHFVHHLHHRLQLNCPLYIWMLLEVSEEELEVCQNEPECICNHLCGDRQNLKVTKLWKIIKNQTKQNGNIKKNVYTQKYVRNFQFKLHIFIFCLKMALMLIRVSWAVSSVVKRVWHLMCQVLGRRVVVVKWLPATIIFILKCSVEYYYYYYYQHHNMPLPCHGCIIKLKSY